MKKWIAITSIVALIKLYDVGLSIERSRISVINVTVIDPTPTAIIDKNKREWSIDLARYLANDNPSQEILAFIDAWQQAEGGDAMFNPVNTTYEMEGSTCYNTKPCVKNYRSYDEGLYATIMTLQGGYTGYTEIAYGIHTNDVEMALYGLSISPWGTSASLVREILYGPEIVTIGAKSRITETMKVGASFSSGSCTPDNSWNFQYECKHWGTDYLCPDRCPGFMPFDMMVVSIGEYGPGPTEGQFIQGVLADGSVLYIGHIVDRMNVSVGDTIPSGTLFGYTNRLAHFHVQLAPPGNYGPCAQNGTCLDFERYWSDH